MYHDGIFYESLPASRQFAAFDGKTGRLKWQLRTQHPVKMSAVESNGILYFGDTGGVLYLIRAATGKIVTEHRFKGTFSTSSPVIVGQTLFLVRGMALYAIPIIAKGRLSPFIR